MIPIRATREFRYLRRPVLVAVSLADLRGPASGVVELPLHLFWSGRDSADSRFSLDDGPGRRVVYRTVLREARTPDDLATFLNGDVLTVLWADIVLPKVVRTAWEDQHPVLRPAAPTSLPALAGRLAGPSAGPRRSLGASSRGITGSGASPWPALAPDVPGQPGCLERPGLLGGCSAGKGTGEVREFSRRAVRHGTDSSRVAQVDGDHGVVVPAVQQAQDVGGHDGAGDRADERRAYGDPCHLEHAAPCG